MAVTRIPPCLMSQHAAPQHSNLLIKTKRPLEHATAVEPKKFLSNLVLPRTAEFTVRGSLTFKL